MKLLKLKKRQNPHLIVALCVLIILFSVLSPLHTFCDTNTSKRVEISQDLEETIIDELNNIDFTSFNAVINEFEDSKTNIFSIDNIKNKIYSVISGENAVSYDSFFASLFSIILDSIVRYIPMLSLIVGIGVISNLLGGIKSKFNEKSTSNLIHLVCFLAVAIVIITIITNLTESTTKSIKSMVSQMNALFPIILTLMAGLGATASVGVFQPIVAIISTYVADFFSYIILPMFMFSFVFGLMSNMTDNIKLDKFNSFISSLFKWCVGVTFTLFFAIFTIQGISAGSFDSVSIRTTKYTIKSYIPIMGGYLSDGMDLILSSTLLIKNSIGLVGVLLILSTIISPLIEIVVCSLCLKLVSAILQPMGNSKTSNFLMSTSKSITMLSTCIIAIGFMYLISIGLMMTTANVVI